MKIKDTAFAYAVSKIRAKETQMLGEACLMRMADAEGTEEAIKILREAGYSGSTQEEMLADELAKTYRLLAEISPLPEAFRLFMVKSDYHNIKVLIKAEYLGKDYDFLLKSDGRIAPERLKDIITSRVLTDLSPIMQKAVLSAIDTLAKTDNPQFADLILDKAAYAEMRSMAADADSAFIQELVKVMIDLANLRMLLRVQKMGKNVEFLLRALIPDGTISPETLARELPKPFAEFLRTTPYRELAEFTQNAAEFEQATEGYLLRRCKQARYVAFGIEPLVAYLLAKEHEIKQVRLVLTGKKNALPTEQIKERLRESYA